jgi:branched-chain amino acid transport system substrate-binding protein
MSSKRLAISDINSDIRIIGLIGHQTSDLTLRFGNIYQKAEIPVISPSATSTELFGKYSYVHLVAPTTHQMAKKLSQQMQGKKVIVFYEYDEEFSKSFGKEICKVITEDRCKFWDFSEKPVINNATIRSMLSDSQTELVIAFNPNKNLDNKTRASMIITAVADVNKEKPQDGIKLFSDNALYDQQIIHDAETKGVIIVRVSPWDRYLSVNSSQGKIEKMNQLFLNENKKIWDTDQVNWYTLMSYNATKSLALAIKRTGSQPPHNDEELTSIRKKTNDIINSDNFKVNGALGEINFKDGYVQGGNFVCITRLGAIANSHADCQPGEQIPIKNENYWWGK